MPKTHKTAKHFFSDEDRQKALETRLKNAQIRQDSVISSESTQISQPQTTLSSIKKLFMDLAEIKALQMFVQPQIQGQQTQTFKENLEMFKSIDDMISARVKQFIDSMPEPEEQPIQQGQYNQESLEQMVLAKFLGFDITNKAQQGQMQQQNITDAQILEMFKQLPKGIIASIKKGTIKKSELKERVKQYNLPEPIFERAYTLLMQQ